MYEIINWIIFWLYATVHVADSLYALYCLFKVKDASLVVKLLLCLLQYTLTLGIPFFVIVVHSPGESNLSRLFALLVSTLIFLPLVIIFNHGCPIEDYKSELKYNKYFVKQKTIKL